LPWASGAGASMTGPLGEAIQAAQGRKALNLRVLNLQGISSFTDYFLICSGTSTRHTQAISDAVTEQLSESGLEPSHIEGYAQAEWILLDYVDFVVHIFLERAREFYDLERLWKKAARVAVPSDGQ
jgi:ribosome-associated protein